MSTEPISQSMDSLRDDYEDSLFRYLMAGYAEEYGKELKARNDALKASGGYEPTLKATKRFNHVMNRAFRKRQIIETSKRTYRTLNRAAIFIVAGFIALGTTAMAVEPVRVEVLNFLIGVQKEYTSLRLDADKGKNIVGDNLILSWTDGYVPTYVPEGYKIVNITNRDNMKSILFENNESRKIDYSEYSANAGVNIDTEDADTEKVEVNGYDALIVKKDGVLSIAWSDGQRIFIIYSQLERNDLIQVAQNVKYVK